jgi:hypothetical protein
VARLYRAAGRPGKGQGQGGAEATGELALKNAALNWRFFNELKKELKG